jgi:large subunit ribosomal protein L31e
MSTPASAPVKKSRSALKDVVSREYTIHLHKHVHGIGFKHRAPRAVKAIRKFAEQQFGTKDVRIDSSLNKQVWSHGIKNVPHRIRVLLSRKRNDDEDAKEKLYTLVTYVPADLTKSNRRGLGPKTVDE